MAWTNPTTRTTGTLITAAIWNTDLVDNLSYLKSSPVIDTAVTLGAATTSGIRLDLESGTLAVREGDDSAYGPINTGALTVASGRALVGTTTARTLTTLDSLVQVETAGSTYQQLSLVANRNDTGGASLILGKSRGTAVNSNTIVADGDNVGFIRFNAADGVDMDSNVAQILAQIDGTPGSNNTPGRLIFSTTDDSAATLTEAVRIDNRQNLGIGVTPSAWGTQYDVQAIELKSGALWNYSTTNIYLGQNYYYNGMLRIYETTAAASEYMQGSGEHYFYTAASGTAGNVISFTERMRITNAGHVQPGANDGGQLGVSGTAWSDLFLASGGVINWNAGDTTLTHTAANTLTVSSAATALRYNVYSTSNSGAPKIALMNGLNSCGIGLLGDSSGTMVLFAGDATTERMRITGGGLVGIGGTPSTYLLDVRGGVTADISIRGVTDSASNVESLRFFCQNTTEGGRISAVRTAASNAPNDLVFYTSVSGTVSECLRLTSGKNMVIPATSKFYLDGGGDTYITEGAANQIRMFTGGVDRFVLTDAQCYINVVYSQTTASAANVFVQSDGLLARSTSSLRYKRDVDTLGADHALAAVMAMRPVTYRGKTDEDQRHHVGFIAEEMAEIAPLLCSYDEGGESGTPNYVTYDRVTAYLVAVVQQQQAKIAALEARLN